MLRWSLISTSPASLSMRAGPPPMSASPDAALARTDMPVSRVRNNVAIAGGACRARSRSEEELMLIHHEDEIARQPPPAIATLFLTRDTCFRLKSRLVPKSGPG